MVERRTRETMVKVEVFLEPGDIIVDTGYRFLDHMLETMLFHAGFSGSITVKENVKVDDHHVVEDTGLALGEALRRAAGSSVERYGYAVIPMDEALVLVAVDYSGRPGAWVDLRFTRSEIGDVASENIIHFVYSLASTLRATIHVRQFAGVNNHHIAEAVFKALGKALSMALSPANSIRSLKGILDVGDY